MMKVSMSFIPYTPTWANKDRIYRNAVSFECDGDYHKALELYRLVLEVLNARPNHKPNNRLFVAARIHVCAKRAGLDIPLPEILMPTTEQ